MFWLAQATQPVTETSSWLQILLGGLATLITVFVIPWIRRLTQEANAAAVNYNLDSSSLQSATTSEIATALRNEAYILALNFAEKKFPQLAADLAAGEIPRTPEAIKRELYSWGKDLKDALLETFDERGIDVVSVLGDRYIDEAVRWAADRVSPFPGRDTATTLLSDAVTADLIKKGVNWVRNRFTTENQGDPEQPA